MSSWLSLHLHPGWKIATSESHSPLYKPLTASTISTRFSPCLFLSSLSFAGFLRSLRWGTCAFYLLSSAVRPPPWSLVPGFASGSYHLVSRRMSVTQRCSHSSNPALEEEMATRSSLLAWRTPWTEEPGGLPSLGSQRVRHNWATKQQHTPQRACLSLCFTPWVPSPSPFPALQISF